MKKNILFSFLFFFQITAFAQSNDECSNAEPYGGFGPNCTIIFEGTTFGATFNDSTDLFSCDSSSLKSSVFYTFLLPAAANSEAVFHLVRGVNINLTVWEEKQSCNTENLELSAENCFVGLNASACQGNIEDAEKVLIKNLTPGKTYTMAIWTDEDKQSDFSFCLTRVLEYECGRYLASYR